MSRYLNPDAPVVAKKVDTLSKVGDGILLPVASVLILCFSVCIGLPLLLTESIIMGLIILAPSVLIGSLYLMWFSHTFVAGTSIGDALVEKTLSNMKALEDNTVRDLALPAARKIISHAQINHGVSDSYAGFHERCPSCRDRVNAIKSLSVDRPDDKMDIQAINMFLESRNSFDS